jgi:membrane fusion protein, multidrug efflux system
VLDEDGTQSVFVVADGKARRREVTLGYADADYYEVLEGLDSGDQVVVTGQSNLKDDVSVSVVNLKPTATAEESSEKPGEDSSQADPAVAQSDAPRKS